MIYLDNQATTPVDPRVIEAMLPMMTEHFANAGSTTHESGRQVASLVDDAMHSLATSLNCRPEEIVITSGATESNNLALVGLATHPRQSRRQIVSCATEHRAILDPLRRLEQLGFEIIFVPVQPNGTPAAGRIDLERLSQVVGPQTALVSIMLANNEIGVIQPLREVAAICRQHDVYLHSDATQAVGRMTVSVQELGVDLLSFSAHKFYGPKGVGGLYVRSAPRRVRVQPQIFGGGQQDNRRSGTLNSPGIVGMARALELSLSLGGEEWPRLRRLRNRLHRQLAENIVGLQLNGPELEHEELRLGGNLNCSFWPVEGQSLMLECPELAISSGSACTSAEPAPSHVLRTLGLPDDLARSSLRFGIGRFNTEAEIDQAAAWLIAAFGKLNGLL